MNKRTTMTYAVAAATAAMLTLAGCNGGDEDPTATPTATSSSTSSASPSGSPSPSTSASPSPSASVTLPSAARERSEKGAVEFAKNFVLEMNKADVSSDPSVISALSDPGCAFCADLVEVTNQNRAEGTRLDKLTMTIEDASVLDAQGSTFVVGLLVSDAAARRVDREGKVISTIPAAKFNAEADVRWADSGWRIARMEVK